MVMCRRLVLVLNSIADKMEGAHRLTTEDEGLLALAQGWAHATTHSIFFYYRCLIHTRALHFCEPACEHCCHADGGREPSAMLTNCSQSKCRRSIKGWRPHASYRRER